MSLYKAANAIIKLQLSAAYTAGSGSFVLKTGQGSNFTTFPIRVTLIQYASYGLNSSEVTGIYGCTGVSGDTLTGITAIEGTTDGPWSINDYVEVRNTAGYNNDLVALCVPFSAAGSSHSGGLVPDPGSTTHSTPYVLGDDSTFHQLTGSAVSYSGGVYTITGGSGTVTTASVVTANGFEGTVANATTTPAITLQTTVSGLLKGSSNAIVSATAGTDYVTPGGSITGTSANVTGTVAITNGGTGQTTATAAYNALSPMTTTGDIEYESAASTASRLAGNTSTTKKFLTQTGTGTVSAAPGWNTLVGTDLPNPSSSSLGGIQSIASVSHQWINSISTSGVPSLSQPAFSDISGNLATTQLNSGTGASSTTYWRGDGTWATPSGGGTVTSVSLTMPSNFSVSGSPVTGSGTLAVTASTPANQVFTSSGTYTVPTGATLIRVIMIGGGGGGGSGAQLASGTASSGGTGGAGGGYIERVFRAADLTSTVSVTVGSGGAGGTAISTTSTNGNSGSAGGSSSFGGYCSAGYGSGGGGGNSGSSLGPNAGAGMFTGGYGNPCSAGAAGGSNAQVANLVPQGGSGGGGVNSSGTGQSGGALLQSYGNGGPFPFAAGVAMGVSGSSGANYSGTGVANCALPGAPGQGGGGGSSGSAGGSGGAGGLYGAGGGGGGSSVNGSNSGAGGAGAAGVVVITAW